MRPRTGDKHRGTVLLVLIALLATIGAAPSAAGAAAGTGSSQRPAAAESAALTLQQAVERGAAEARETQGASTSVTVIDRRTGKVVARTDNADTQVASESISKVLLAAFYLIRHRGKLPTDIEPDLRRMIEASDDDLATAYWDDRAIPVVVERYGLTGIETATPDPGYWGGTAITADGMAKFLYEMSNDSWVGPWLTAAMKNTTNVGVDGFDQNFGFNTLDGVASKQGWGSDNDIFLPSEPNAVHSIGLTHYYAAAVLQTGPAGTYRSLGAAATNTVDLIQSATVPRPPATSTAAPTTSSAVADTGRAGSDGPAAVEASGWWRRALAF